MHRKGLRREPKVRIFTISRKILKYGSLQLCDVIFQFRCDPEAFNKTIQKCWESCQDSMCNFQQYQKIDNGIWFHLYNFFGLLWLMCFVNDLGDMVLAGCFAGWYWTFNRSKNLTTFPVGSSLARTVRYHLGTVAFGSLIISIIKFIRYFLEYIDYKTRQYQ